MIETQKWQLCADALNGTGGFDDGGKLIAHFRETDEKLAARKKVAWYVNFMRAACSRFAGFLAKSPPIRNNANRLQQLFIENADNQGTPLTQFMNQLAFETKARGTMLILIDMPNQTESTEQTQFANRTIPYLVAIEPERLTKYKLTQFGEFEFIEFNGLFEIDGKLKEVKWYYDIKNWKVERNGELIAKGEHNLGKTPIIAFTEQGIFPHVGAFYQIAEISQRYYNMVSELDEVLRSQTFSILTYHLNEINDQSIKAVVETIGTNNMLAYAGDRPAFIAPDASPAQIYEQRLQSLEKLIAEISLDISGSQAQESGLALNYRFQRLNSELIHMAKRLEAFERQIFELFNLWMGFNQKVEISYAKDFNLSDLKTEIETYQNMQQMNAPQSYLQEKLKQIVSIDLPDLAQETAAKIESEIEENTHERTTE